MGSAGSIIGELLHRLALLRAQRADTIAGVDVFRDLPKRAPPAPRAVTPDMVLDTDPAGRFLRRFGAIWAGVGFGIALPAAALAGILGTMAPLLGTTIGGVFGIAGSLLLAYGWWRRARAIRVFRDGVEAEGEIVSVGVNTHVRMNRKHPWRIVYRFMAGGRPVEGVATSWAAERPEVAAGNQVIVLHDAKHPGRSVIWNRVEPIEPVSEAVPTVRLRVEAGAGEEQAAEEEAIAEQEAIAEEVAAKSSSGSGP
jgi:Protein of unknown function (DUF3592)